MTRTISLKDKNIYRYRYPKQLSPRILFNKNRIAFNLAMRFLKYFFSETGPDFHIVLLMIFPFTFR